jgi:predicted kinase
MAHAPGMSEHRAMLIALAGRPGTGKTTIARLLASRLGAAWLRIDTIEQALLASGVSPEVGGIGDVGYRIAHGIAADTLRVGRSVVVDAVNPVEAARIAWLELAARAGVPGHLVEIVCSDASEHRRRVERREPDIAGHRLPTWEAVTRMRYDPIVVPALIVDSARADPDRAVASIVAHLAAASGPPVDR